MPLNVQAEFDAPATLFVVALMFMPLLAAMGVSVYENRLSVYFSEQVGPPVNLEKRHLIFSVLITSCVPVFALSFGLLGVSQLTDRIWPALPGEPARQSPQEQAIFYLFSLGFSLLAVALLKRLLFRKHLSDPALVEARDLFRLWQFRLNLLATFLNVTLYWTAFWVASWLSPGLVTKTIT